jgi:MFS family permease
VPNLDEIRPQLKLAVYSLHKVGYMHSNKDSSFLFWACFVALVATSFGFISRVFMLGDWQIAFNLSETQMGEIFGAGLWPFAISIVVVSLIVDRIGYGRAMGFAFACHLVSAVMTIMATGYSSLYWAAFVGALGSGTVEAVINPVVATMYPKEKTRWLNVLHAGWPGGLMLAGILTLILGGLGVGWKIKVALIFVPVIAYGIMLLRCKFPVNERVAAGIPYRDMLREPGGAGIFIVTLLIVCELSRVLFGVSFPSPQAWIPVGISLLIAVAYGLGVKSLGRPMYILMLMVMLLLATTELGTDGWIKELMGPAMELIGLDGGWILVYTATIMTILRFLIGPILKATRLTPLGLLAWSSVAVIVGIIWLSKIDTAAGLAILVAATIYGAGQCFFWPTTLGFISEQFPRGGALSLNAIAGVGMLGVGILGGPWLGYIQNSTIESRLQSEDGVVYEQVIGESTGSMFGDYRPIDGDKLEALPAAAQEAVAGIRNDAKMVALLKVAVLPLLMLICYVGLIRYFRNRGGYKPVELAPGG